MTIEPESANLCLPGRPFRIEELPQCLNNKISISYVFQQPISDRQMQLLAALGKAEVRRNFPRPLFKVFRAFAFLLIGIIGDCELRVDYEKQSIAQSQPLLEELFVRMTDGHE